MTTKYRNKELLLEYKSAPSLKKKDYIIRHNIPLINDIVNKRYNYPNMKDDLVQEGMIALSNCIDNFDPSKGEFTSFSYQAINNRMINWLFRNQHTVRLPKGKRAEFISDEFSHLKSDPDSFDIIEHSISKLNICERRNLEKIIFSDEPHDILEYKAAEKFKKAVRQSV